MVSNDSLNRRRGQSATDALLAPFDEFHLDIRQRDRFSKARIELHGHEQLGTFAMLASSNGFCRLREQQRDPTIVAFVSLVDWRWSRTRAKLDLAAGQARQTPNSRISPPSHQSSISQSRQLVKHAPNKAAFPLMKPPAPEGKSQTAFESSLAIPSQLQPEILTNETSSQLSGTTTGPI